jgi:hypothetical protein
MILHIIKKDLRLLWPFVVGLTALNAITQWMRYGFSVLDNNAGWVIFGPLAVVGWVLLVAVLVHQDVIPGTRQDWLTRPIRRRDLVAAKLLFVVGLLHAPLFVMMTIEVLAAGYSLADAIGGAFVRNLSIFFGVSLPTLAVAAVSRNLIEAIIVAILVAVVSEPVAVLFDVLTNEPCGATCGSSLAWVGIVAIVVVIAVAALVVIALQYFKRGAIFWARGAMLVAAVAFVLAERVSWDAAFALQRFLTGAPAEPASVVLSVDRGEAAAPLQSAAERAAIMTARARLVGEESAPSLEGNAVTRSLAGTTISLPLRVDGQRPDTVLWVDRVEIRLLDAGGRVVHHGEGDELELRAGASGFLQTFFIPADVLTPYARTELRAEIDYWLTSLEENAAATLREGGGETRLPSGELCASQPLRAASAIRVSCLTVNPPPPCYTAALEGGADLLVCAPRYWPDALWGNLFARFDVNVPVTAGARVDGAVRVVTYEPRDHFTTQVVVPQLRLADWVVESPR